MAKKKTKSNPPSGLSLVRDGDKFILTWKIPSSKYGDGQQFNYKVDDDGKDSWKSKSIGKTATSKSHSIDKTHFFPYSGKPHLYSIQMRVRGNRDKDKGDSYLWSDWATKVFDIEKPNKPSCVFSLDNSVSYTGSFSWAVSTSNTSKKVYTRVLWETILVKDCDVTEGKQIAGKFKSSTLGWETGTSTSTSGSKQIVENSVLFQGAYSYTRWFRIRSQGPRGSSDWVYSKHVYAVSSVAKNLNVDCPEVSGGYMPSVKWTSPSSAYRPIDKTEVQYTKQKPISSNLDCPVSGFDWTVGATIKDTSGKDGATFYITGRLLDDECLYMRVSNYHDGLEKPGPISLVKVGNLKDLTSFTVTPDLSDPPTYKITATAVNASEVTAPVKRAIIYKSTSRTDIIAVLNDNDSHIIQCPNWSEEEDVSFQAFAFVGDIVSLTQDSMGVSIYKINARMKSSSKVFSLMGQIPEAPEVTVDKTDISGTVKVSWDWTWTKAMGAELSWANHIDAWQSTSPPETYDVTSLGNPEWNISDLALGEIWYIRVRLYSGSGDNIVYSPYCDPIPIKLLSAPDIPDLRLSSGIIPQDGSVTASWVYVSTDSTPQSYAEIAVVNEGVYTKLASTLTAQHITLKASDFDWQSGNTYNLALRVKSQSGVLSEWSDIQPVIIADALTCQISETSLVTESIIDDPDQPLVTRSVQSLKDLPLTLTVTGNNTGVITTVIIERADSFHLQKPDETDFNGYANETIVIKNPQPGSGSISIEYNELIGSLDDGAIYNLIAIVQDELGQVARDELSFEVHWSHQASIPSANIVVDNSEMIVKITPRPTSGIISTDTCDIYRLSVDRPELIYEGAIFNTTYVDPYPTLGDMGGYLIVTKTANGDYTTADNVIAWFNTRDEGLGIIENTDDLNIIDFSGGQIRFYYNSDLSHSWEKDFERTKYLGGSVQGDWNPAVVRDGTISTLAITTLDQEMLQLVRRLAVYDGPCHVRTSDGSSFTANVEVSEESDHSDLGMRVSYSIKVEQIESESLDGMTLAEWNALQ